MKLFIIFIEKTESSLFLVRLFWRRCINFLIVIKKEKENSVDLSSKVNRQWRRIGMRKKLYNKIKSLRFYWGRVKATESLRKSCNERIIALTGRQNAVRSLECAPGRVVLSTLLFLSFNIFFHPFFCPHVPLSLCRVTRRLGPLINIVFLFFSGLLTVVKKIIKLYTYRYNMCVEWSLFILFREVCITYREVMEETLERCARHKRR